MDFEMCFCLLYHELGIDYLMTEKKERTKVAFEKCLEMFLLFCFAKA